MKNKIFFASIFSILFFFVFTVSLVLAATTTVCSDTVCNVTFTTSNSSWLVPSGVTSITGLVVGGGGGGYKSTSAGGGGAGGALRYSSSITVVSGQNLTIIVGTGGAAGAGGAAGGFSSISNSSTTLLLAAGGAAGTLSSPGTNNGTSTTIDGVITGGNGGAGGNVPSATAGCSGGGGAGGWYGGGGAGGARGANNGVNSTGGGGGGGGASLTGSAVCGGGGGVGIVAAGNNGTGGATSTTAASPGTNGSQGNDGVGSAGGLYGGGGGGDDTGTGAGAGNAGAAVITYLVPDLIYPLFSNIGFNYTNGSAYVNGRVYTANATIINTNGTAGIEFNGTNYTATNVSSLFTSTLGQLSAGTYSYYWWARGNGTQKKLNITSTMYYTVAQATPTLTKLLNGVNNNLTVVYPQQVNASGSTTGGTLNIYRDGTLITNGANYTLGVAYYRFDFNITGGTNYTNVSQPLYANVTKATPVLTFLANGGTSNLSLIYPQQVNISASASAGTVGLDKDNVNYLTNNGLNVSLSAGSYIFRANITGNQNYSNVGYSYYNVTINKTVPQGNLTNTTSWTVTYPTSVTIGRSESNNGDGDVTYVVYRDNVNKGTGETITLGTGGYNYLLNTTGGANYSANSSMDAQTLTINQNTTYTLSLSILSSTTETYPTQINATGTNCPSELTCNLYNNQTGALTNGANYTFGAGIYNITYNTTGNTNYSAKSVSQILTINKATPSGTITGTSSIDYGTAGDVEGTETNNGDGGCEYKLYRDNIEVLNPDTTILGAGTYNYIYNTTGCVNYSASASLDTFELTINQISSSVNLTLNNSESNITITTGTAIDLNCSTLTGDSGAILTLHREGSVINSGTSPIGNTTTFNTIQVENITCIYSDSQNYTSGFETWFVHVEAADTCTCPELNQNWEIDMGDSCNIVDACDLGTGNITFIGEGTTTFNAAISSANLEYPTTNQILNIGSNAVVTIG